MAARESGPAVLFLASRPLRLLLLLPLVAGRWGPAGAGGAAPGGEPGRRGGRSGAAARPCRQSREATARTENLGAVNFLSWGLGVRFQFKCPDVFI